MGKNLLQKTGFIIAVLVIFTYMIFYGLDIPKTGPITSLRNGNIHLGLDLKGGSHLVLKVNTAEAVSSATDRDVARLNGVLATWNATAVKLDPVNHPDQITVTGGTPAQ